MRIAQIAPAVRVGPPAAVRRHRTGHRRPCATVSSSSATTSTLFAAGTSSTRAPSFAPHGLPAAQRMTPTSWPTWRRTSTCRCSPTSTARQTSSTSSTPTPTSGRCRSPNGARMPTVMTLHGRLDTTTSRKTLPLYPRRAVGVDQRPPAPRVEHDPAALGGDGVQRPRPAPDIAAQPRARSDALRLRRPDQPGEGPDAGHRGCPAGRVARCTIAAKVDPLDVEYFEQQIEPLLRRRHSVRRRDRRAVTSPPSTPAPRRTLFPSDWPEPFGLVMIESLAAGTPVIALRRGSVPEVAGRRRHRVRLRRRRRDGRPRSTGSTRSIPTTAVARAAEFSLDSMCARYESVYSALVEPSAVLANAS